MSQTWQLSARAIPCPETVFGRFPQNIGASPPLATAPIAKEVILPAVIKPGLPGVTFRGAHRAMVIKELFTERSRLPTLQASGPDRDPINPTPFNRCVPANFMKTLTPKQLARSEHVAHIVETVLQGLIFRFSHRSAGHAKSGKSTKFADQEFEIITFKGDVSVKVP